MPISIECPTYEQYYAVSALISEVHNSPTLGLEEFYALLTGLPGFKDEGRCEAESEGNFVRVFYACSLTDLLAAAVPVRWERVYWFCPLPFPNDPNMRKFAVHFRDQFGARRDVQVWALNEAEAVQTIARDGYGHAGRVTFYPRLIEKAELVSA